jgi:4-hydroxybenzoate polyprenyltransferase
MPAIRPWLQLVRLPAVFTALADIFCGFLLVHDNLAPEGRPFTFVLLLAASACLYLAGMVLNDLFDRTVDAVERPQRPIPSGRVSPAAAGGLAAVLVGAGLAAAFIAGIVSGGVALALTALIFAYNGLLKATPLGPLAMGGCRFLNVILGASAVAAEELGQPPVLCVAGGLGVYIAGVTWFARNEAGRSRRASLMGAASIVNLGVAALAGLVLFYPWDSRPEPRDRQVVFLLLVISLFSIDRRLGAAIREPLPGKVQTAVKTMLLSLIALDASIVLIATRDPWLSGGTVLLLVPAALLGRWVFVT